MFVRSALLLTSVGVVVGMGTAAALMQLMVSVPFELAPLDSVTYITLVLSST